MLKPNKDVIVNSVHANTSECCNAFRKSLLEYFKERNVSQKESE